jgi:hypothetical protein
MIHLLADGDIVAASARAWTDFDGFQSATAFGVARMHSENKRYPLSLALRRVPV